VIEQIARRRLLLGAGAAMLASTLPGCATVSAPAAAGAAPLLRLPTLTPLRISADRITGITVCSRPFRAAGPRLEMEKIGLQSVLHHYGHGGSGWSLSWGTGAVAAATALATGERDIGVIGCGAIGLTTALQLQRAGAHQVTIYAKERPPEVLSAFATGVWSPGSRIGMAESLTHEYKQQWQSMTRHSWRMFQMLLGLPGNPVEFVDMYGLSDTPPVQRPRQPRTDGKPEFAELEQELTPEIGVRSVPIDTRNQPFTAPYVRRGSRLMFNLPAYSRMLMADFRANGGRIVIDEFHSPADFARLPHKTLVNSTGYGARALLGDNSIVPVRGQLTRLIPEPGAYYGMQYRKVSVTPRRDGIILQYTGDDDYYGYGDATREPDQAIAELAVTTIAGAFKTRG
jgi:D-amino-acid oxidase